MRVLLALLKKDRIWMASFLLIGSGIFTALVLDLRADLLWIGAGRRGTEDVMAGWWIWAGLFGLYAGLRDRVLGTREYLLHRPVRAQRIFWTRCLGCALVMALAALLPYVLTWLSPFDTQNRAVWEFDRIWYFLALSTSMWTAFAVGMYGATVPGSKPAAVFQTALVGVPFLFLAWRAQYPLGDAWSVAPWFYVTAQAALAGVLLVLSAAQFVRGADRDRAVAPRLKVPNVLLLASSAALLLAIPVSELQRDRYGALLASYPRIRERQDGTFERVARRWDGKRTWFQVVDADHEPTNAAPEPATREVVAAFKQWWQPGAVRFPDFERQLEPARRKARDGHALGGIRRHVQHGYGGGGPVDIQAWLEVPAGVVQAHGLYYLPRGETYPPWHRTFRRADGEAFSPQTVFRGRRGVLALDPADGTVWHAVFSEESAGFEPVALPAGDRIRELRYLFEWTTDASGARVRLGSTPRLGAVGDEGTYLLQEDLEKARLVPAPSEYVSHRRGDARGPASSGWPPQHATLARRGADPITFRVVVPAEDGATAPASQAPRFTAFYRPRTAGEQFDAGLVQACAVVRSPVLALLSPALDAPGLWPFDPLLSFGGRPWLLGLNLLLAGLLVLLARRRLRKLGADPATRLLWTLLVAAGGLGVLVVMLALERRRAYAHVAVREPVDLPALLIRSA